MAEIISNASSTTSAKALKGLRLMVLLPALKPGGGEAVAFKVIWAAVEAGAKVLLCAAETKNFKANDERLPVRYSNFQFSPLTLNKKGALRLLVDRHVLSKTLSAFEPNLIHSFSRWPSFLLQFPRSLAPQVPFITTIQGHHGSGWLKDVYNSYHLRGRNWIAVSGFIQEHFEQKYPRYKDKSRCFNAGADLDRFSPNPTLEKEGKAFRLSLGIKPQDLLLLAPSRLSASYDTKHIIDSLMKLEAESVSHLSKLHLVLFADKQTKEKNAALIQDAKNLQQISCHVLAPMADPLPAFAACDLLVTAAAKPGAFGLVIAEAHALGKPVFATAMGGAIEQIDNPEAEILGSRLFAPQGAENKGPSLYECLAVYLSRPQVRQAKSEQNECPINQKQQALRQQAWQSIRKRHTLQEHTNLTLSLYSKFTQ